MAYMHDMIANEFPILKRQVHGKPLCFLDSAASSLTCERAVRAMNRYYHEYRCNIHRGVYEMAQEATSAYEQARSKAQAFIGAEYIDEIIFVRGTTEAINLVAQSLSQDFIGKGDEILITMLEHHSNIVPWQLICERVGAVLKVLPVDAQGNLEMSQLGDLLSKKTKLVAVNHVANAIGTVNPVADMIKASRHVGARVLVDGAQAAPHLEINVKDLDCDYYTVSGHKMFGPTGIGVLYGKRSHLQTMAPYQGGGDMIETVTMEKTTFAKPPARFEAGTPNIAGAIGLAGAIDFMEELGFNRIQQHENELVKTLEDALDGISGVRIIGEPNERASLVSFVVDGINAQDVATILDQQGVAVRVGHHCAQPLLDFFGVSATIRASLACYNTRSDIDVLSKALKKAIDMLG